MVKNFKANIAFLSLQFENVTKWSYILNYSFLFEKIDIFIKDATFQKNAQRNPNLSIYGCIAFQYHKLILDQIFLAIYSSVLMKGVYTVKKRKLFIIN